MSLTKRRIAQAIHEADPEISISRAVRLVDRVIDSIRRRLERGDKVMITNFGTFEVATRAPRRGINPASGERMLIPRHRVVVFRPAPALQRRVDG